MTSKNKWLNASYNKLSKYCDHRSEYSARSGRKDQKGPPSKMTNWEWETCAQVREVETVYLNQRPFWDGLVFRADWKWQLPGSQASFFHLFQVGG